jgi:hypothetical protein
MVTSIIGVEHHFQQHVIYNMVTSIIGVDNSHIVESGIQHQ